MGRLEEKIAFISFAPFNMKKPGQLIQRLLFRWGEKMIQSYHVMRKEYLKSPYVENRFLYVHKI
jgi:hypothetical protein